MDGQLDRKRGTHVRDEDKREYCRSFLRNWCHAAHDCSFRVVSGYRRPRRVEANAIPAEFLEDNRGK